MIDDQKVEDQARIIQAEQAVLLAAEKIERGCDCEIDYRCGRCEHVVDLREAIDALRILREAKVA